MLMVALTFLSPDFTGYTAWREEQPYGHIFDTEALYIYIYIYIYVVGKDKKSATWKWRLILQVAMKFVLQRKIFK